MLPFGEAPHAEAARQYRVGQAIKVVITHLEPGERHSLWLRLADGPAEETDIVVPGVEDA